MVLFADERGTKVKVTKTKVATRVALFMFLLGVSGQTIRAAQSAAPRPNLRRLKGVVLEKKKEMKQGGEEMEGRDRVSW